MPKYSFIVPVYNCGPYLTACVDSLLNQSLKDFEILLVDDGSTDGSGALCDRMAEKYGCIRSFHKENGGAASARNFGIDQVLGDYLIFIDGDDTVEPDTLERTEEASSCELIIFGMAFDYYGKHNVLLRTDHLSCSLQSNLDISYFIQNFRKIFNDNALSSACNKVFSARIIQEYGLRFPEDMTLYEDLDFVLRYLGFTNNLYCIPVPLYHYRIDADNFSNKRAHQLEKLQCNLHRLGETMLAMTPVPDEAPTLMANLYMQFLLRHLTVSKYRPGNMISLYRYCDDAVLRQCLQAGAVMEGQERDLLEMIDSHAETELAGWLRKKKIKIYIRKRVKQILRALGIRR